MSKQINMSGKVYGDFLVTKEHENRNGKTYWKCVCNTCFYDKWLRRSNILAGIGIKCPVCNKKEG